MRLVLSGGGTGGHVLPILAVVTELKHRAPDIELLYIGSVGGIEEKIVTGKVDAVFIHAGKFRRYKKSLLYKLLDVSTNFKNLTDIFRLISGFSSAFKKLRSYKPDAVFIKGGYVGLPVGLAAAALKIPFALHESDSVAGLANRILSKWASAVYVSFPLVWGLPKEKLVFTGSPVRDDIGSKGKSESMEYFGFSNSLPTIFIIGGSQGAHKINEAVLEVLQKLLAECQVIHATGDKDIRRLISAKEKLDPQTQSRYRPYAYLGKELPYAYGASDLIVSRAGGTVFEIAAVGLPSLLIPLPHGTNDHQLKNAQVFSQEGAAHVLLDEEVTGDTLYNEIMILLNDPTKRAELAKNARRLHDPKAAFRIAVHLLNLPRTAKK